jgi:hypothetical protein
MESLTIDPGLPLEITHEYEVRQSEGLPMRQRRAVHKRVRRRFRVLFDLLCIADKNTVVALFTACKGRAARFLFTPPDESTPLEFRFDRDDLEWTAETASRRSMALEFSEAF